jgi:Flp pilus assembly protein CpaB
LVWKYSGRSPGKLIAILLTIVAGFTVYFAFFRAIDPVPVVVAREDIEESSPIQSNQLQVVKVARKDFQEGAFHTIADVKGNTAGVMIFAGQQIIAQQLGEKVTQTLGNIKPNQTLLTLNTQQAAWPKLLRVGDLVTVVAVYKETGELKEEAVGRIVESTSGSVIRNLKSIQEAQATSPSQTEISFVTDIAAAQRVLKAINMAQLVYLMPRHPVLGGVD